MSEMDEENNNLSRLARFEMRRTRSMLSECPPHIQAEAIAHHYTSCAQVALHLAKMLNIRRQSDTVTEEFERGIRDITERLKKAHREDLGLELEWDQSGHAMGTPKS